MNKKVLQFIRLLSAFCFLLPAIPTYAGETQLLGIEIVWHKKGNIKFNKAKLNKICELFGNSLSQGKDLWGTGIANLGSV